MTRVVVLCCLVLSACDELLELPAAPVEEGVRVTSVAPASGFARDLVRIEGTGFGEDARFVRVTLGASSPVQPRSLVAGVLELLVPDDATDGPVVVEVARGRATASEPFDFLGLGHLRNGLVAESTSIEPLLEQVLPTADAFFVIDASRYEQAAWVANGQAAPLGLAHVRAAVERRGQAGFAAVVLDVDDADAPVGTRCAGHLVVFEGQAILRRIALHTDTIGCRPWSHLASDPSGRWAVVASNGFSRVIDLENGSSQELDVRATGPVTSVSADEFVLASADRLHRARFDGSRWVQDAPADVLERAWDRPIALGGADGGRLAMVTTSGRISLFDGSTWPPSGLARFGFSHHFASRGAVAWAQGLDAVAVTYDDSAFVSVWSVGGVSLGTVDLGNPRGISASGDYFFVARPGGWTAVSAATGGLVDAGSVESGAIAAVLREVEPSAGGPRQPMVEVVSTAFGRVLRLDPATLQPVQGFDPVVLAEGPRPAWAGLVGDSLVLLREQRLSRIGPEGGAEEAAIGVSFGENVLAQSARGFGASGLVFVYGYDTGLDADVIVAVELPSEGPARARRVVVPLESTLAAEGDAVVLTEADRVRVWDRAAFLEQGASATVRLDKRWTDALSRASVTGRDSLVVLLSWEGKQRVERLTLSTGEWTVGGPALVPGGSTDAIALSPSGRHLWLVTGERAKSLFGWPLDGATLGAPDPALAVPNGVLDPLVFPDGEGLVLLDGLQDGLRLLR